jgi:hypothetical protein
MTDDLDILRAQVTHFERTLRLREYEIRRLRAELRRLRPSVEQMKWERPRSHYPNPNQQNGSVER